MSYYTTKEALDRLKRLYLGEVVQALEEKVEMDNSSDPNERMVYSEIQKAIRHLDKAAQAIENLMKPIQLEGKLIKLEDGKYALPGMNYGFSSGSSIEVLVYDEFFGVEEWVPTRFEHTNGDYYFYDAPKLKLEGAMVRKRLD